MPWEIAALSDIIAALHADWWVSMVTRRSDWQKMMGTFLCPCVTDACQIWQCLDRYFTYQLTTSHVIAICQLMTQSRMWHATNVWCMPHLSRGKQPIIMLKKIGNHRELPWSVSDSSCRKQWINPAPVVVCIANSCCSILEKHSQWNLQTGKGWCWIVEIVCVRACVCVSCNANVQPTSGFPTFQQLFSCFCGVLIHLSHNCCWIKLFKKKSNAHSNSCLCKTHVPVDCTIAQTSVIVL